MIIVKQDVLKYQFLKNLSSEVWKGGFQLIQILGLLGIYFDAVVVEVKTFFTFIQIGSGHTVYEQCLAKKINSNSKNKLFLKFSCWNLHSLTE